VHRPSYSSILALYLSGEQLFAEAFGRWTSFYTLSDRNFVTVSEYLVKTICISLHHIARGVWNVHTSGGRMNGLPTIQHSYWIHPEKSNEYLFYHVFVAECVVNVPPKGNYPAAISRFACDRWWSNIHTKSLTTSQFWGMTVVIKCAKVMFFDLNPWKFFQVAD